MGAEEDLPVYQAKEKTKVPDESPPAYQAPSVYRVGLSSLSNPLVTIPQLKAHLALLRAFKELRTTVQDTDAKVLGLPVIVVELTPDKRWTWFVGLAVER